MTIAVMLSLSACVNFNQGKPFDTDYANTIERGVTTKQEIRAHLGDPLSITHTADGVAWRYHFWDVGGRTGVYKSMMTGQQVSGHDSEIIITFEGDTVSDFTLTEKTRYDEE